MSVLLGLSFRHTRHGRQMPHVPSNEERLRALRQVLPAQIGNGYAWPHKQAEAYARDAMQDAQDDMEDWRK